MITFTHKHAVITTCRAYGAQRTEATAEAAGRWAAAHEAARHAHQGGQPVPDHGAAVDLDARVRAAERGAA